MPEVSKRPKLQKAVLGLGVGYDKNFFKCVFYQSLLREWYKSMIFCISGIMPVEVLFHPLLLQRKQSCIFLQLTC